MEVKELEDRGNFEELKKESFNLQLVIAHSSKDIIQIDSPAKIDEDILREFRNRSKPVKLITLDRKEWSTRAISLDKEFIFVRVPSILKANTGTLILVEFSTVKGRYIAQTFVHQVRYPILCLKFQDPRKNDRYIPPSKTFLYYAMVSQDVHWLKDSRASVIRTTGQTTGNMNKFFSKETIGIYQEENKDGKEVFSSLDKDMERLKTDMLKGELVNISLGGCAFIDEDKVITPKSILYLSIELKDIQYENAQRSLTLQQAAGNLQFEGVELSLFAIIRNVIPQKGNLCRYGVSFIRNLDYESLNKFFEKWKRSG